MNPTQSDDLIQGLLGLVLCGTAILLVHFGFVVGGLICLALGMMVFYFRY